jgi:ribonuclease R
MLSVARSFGSSDVFPPAVIEERKGGARTWGGRDAPVDRTKDLVYTIDPVDAKDHDDAISVERLGDGFQPAVHRGRHYWVDERRLSTGKHPPRQFGLSTGHVIPMLPEVLSNDVCSSA